MARIDNLNNFLTDVAGAIKNKTGVTSITPANFDTAINNISTGLNIDGLLEEYYVAAGENINPGTFIEFIQGAGATTTATTPFVTIPINRETGIDEHNYFTDEPCMAIQLSDNKVIFVGNMGSRDYHNVLGAVGLTFKNSVVTTTNVIVLASGDVFRGFFAFKGDDKTGFIIYGKQYCSLYFDNNILYPFVLGDSFEGDSTHFQDIDNRDSRRLVTCFEDPYGGIVFKDDESTANNYSWGMCTFYKEPGPEGDPVQNLDTGKMLYLDDLSDMLTFSADVLAWAGNQSFVLFGHNSNTKEPTNNDIYAICGKYDTSTTKYTMTVSSVYTVSTDDDYAGNSTQKHFCIFNPTTHYGVYMVDKKVGTFLDGTREKSVNNLKGFTVYTNGSTLSCSAQTFISDNVNLGYQDLMGTRLSDDKFAIYWSNGYDKEMYGKICSMTTSLSQGPSILMAPNNEIAGDDSITPLTASSILYPSVNMDGTHDEILQGREFFYSGLVLTDTGLVSTQETQVRKATKNLVNGIAQTGGVGGTEFEHNEKVSVYVPQI